MELTLKREFSYYMLTIYVPTCMLVIVSWFSFWIDPKAVPARVALGVTTVLSVTKIGFGGKAKPQVIPCSRCIGRF